MTRKKLKIQQKNKDLYAKNRFFPVRPEVLNIHRNDFGKDIHDKCTSYFDRLRISISLSKYHPRLYNRKVYNTRRKETNYRNSIIEDKVLLRELNENSKGVRCATNSEINELNKRIDFNKFPVIIAPCFLILWILIDFLQPSTLSSFVLLQISIIPIVIILIYMLIFSYFWKVFKVRNAVYLIIECNASDKISYKIGRRTKIYKIRCRDKRKIYIDNWFSCTRETYHNKLIKIVVVKGNNKKAYIGSFDKMWRTHPYIVRY